jgi:hypothetical protein
MKNQICSKVYEFKQMSKLKTKNNKQNLLTVKLIKTVGFY